MRLRRRCRSRRLIDGLWPASRGRSEGRARRRIPACQCSCRLIRQCGCHAVLLGSTRHAASDPRRHPSPDGRLLLDALGTLVALEPPAPRLRAELADGSRSSVTEEQAGARAAAPRSRYYRAHLDEGRDGAACARCGAAAPRCCGRRCRRRRAERGRRPPSSPTRPARVAALHAPSPTPRPAIAQARARGLAGRRRQQLGRLAARGARRALGLAPLLDGVVTSAEVGRAQAGAGGVRARAGARRRARPPRRSTSATASRRTSPGRARPGSSRSCSPATGRAGPDRPSGCSVSRACLSWRSCSRRKGRDVVAGPNLSRRIMQSVPPPAPLPPSRRRCRASGARRDDESAVAAVDGSGRDRARLRARGVRGDRRRRRSARRRDRASTHPTPAVSIISDVVVDLAFVVRGAVLRRAREGRSRPADFGFRRMTFRRGFAAFVLAGARLLRR